LSIPGYLASCLMADHCVESDLASAFRGGHVLRRKGRLVLIASALVLLLSPRALFAQKKQAEPKPFGILTTANAAHSLTTEQAARKYPLHLRATVTYYDPYIDPRHAALFVCDSTGCIFVRLQRLILHLRAGMVIDVEGVSGPGDFAPIVDEPKIRVVGESHVPTHAPRVGLTQMMTGKDDGQWIEVEGLVHSVVESETNVTLTLVVADGTVSATTVKQKGSDYGRLVDTKVLIHANVAPFFSKYRQMIGVRLLFPTLAEVKVEEPAPAEPFSLPLRSINHLLRFAPDMALQHRVLVRGRVTLYWPKRLLCIADDTAGLCAPTTQVGMLAPGDLTDVAGFPVSSGYIPTLEDAIFRPAGADQPVRASPITAEQAMAGDHDAEMVQIRGTLVQSDLTAKDQSLVLSSAGILFSVVLLKGPGEIPAWTSGSKVQVTGICSIQIDTDRMMPGEWRPQVSGFRILLRSPSDVVVIESPSWWSPSHAIAVLGVATLLTMLVLAWVVVLRNRVHHQTRTIRQQLQEASNLRAEAEYRATHDFLSGIYNRVAIMELLNREASRCQRTRQEMSVLMVDIDHFKAVNDTYGHFVGDEVIKQVTLRMGSALRPYDSVGRFGGEEFLILIPNCALSEAILIAERLRLSVAKDKMEISQFSIPVTVSVGVSTMKEAVTDMNLALQAVDLALYEAKKKGRNRVECYVMGIPLTQVAPTGCGLPSVFQVS
jgi:diguanylate cyclase (GGDEF)-like protein